MDPIIERQEAEAELKERKIRHFEVILTWVAAALIVAGAVELILTLTML